jgi:hypothetical protein
MLDLMKHLYVARTDEIEWDHGHLSRHEEYAMSLLLVGNAEDEL